ncbi:MAG: tRNA epoxyqueuosine(34) reductase QueG [Chitinophagaceae bacterium]
MIKPYTSLENINKIKKKAKELGFEYCGIAKAEPLYEDALKLEKWLSKGYHGKMSYMEKWFDIRINPSLLLPNAQSIICLLYNYYPQKSTQEGDIKISKYALSKEDYHAVIRKLLTEFLDYLKLLLGNIEGRGFVDSAPILERTWAVKSGLGWVGKNGNLITKNQGSFFFIATLVIDVSLKADVPFKYDFCGTCTQCIDACPTQAILPNKTIQAHQCISYFTIELKESFSTEIKQPWKNWIFGCDICQDVCPWNKNAIPHNKATLDPIIEIHNLTSNDWVEMEEKTFKTLFGKSALERAKLKKIKDTILTLKN